MSTCEWAQCVRAQHAWENLGNGQWAMGCPPGEVDVCKRHWLTTIAVELVTWWRWIRRRFNVFGAGMYGYLVCICI
jgi:hypothetical protein